jgi:glycosyltransferase involved in cell wall biosynthesis
MNTSNPTFSIIVNTVDRANPLRTLLRTLQHQTYPHFEVLVVVGPTQDETLEVLAEFGDRVRVLRCPEANLSQSRNIGLLAARGDIIAYTDDDAVLSRRWLEQLVQLFQDPHLDGTGGFVFQHDPRYPGILYCIGIASSFCEQYLVRRSMLDQIVPEGAGSQWFMRVNGNNMAFRRQALLTSGGFDEFYIWVAEETDLCFRMVNAGHLIHPVKELSIHHFPAASRNRDLRQMGKGRWWLETRSLTYYTIKNGRVAGDSDRAVLLRILHLVHGHCLKWLHMRSQGDLTNLQAVRLCLGEVRGALEGAAGALTAERKLIPAAQIERVLNQQPPAIQPFQSAEASFQSAVDPNVGRAPVISMPEEPLHLCLTSGFYPPNNYSGIGRHTNLMARGLFECGHVVHVVTQGEKEMTTFYDGAYVHAIPYRLDRYQRYRHFPNLHHMLNYSHAVHDKVKRLHLNEGIQLVDSPLWQVNGLVTAKSELLPVVLRLQTATRQVSDIQKDEDLDKQMVGEIEKSLIEQADYLVPNSKATLSAIITVYGLDSQPYRATIIPHGIEPVAEEQVSPFPLANPPETLTVLYVGRLERRKGIRALMEAIPTVLARMPNVRFLIAGEDNSVHDGFRTQTGQDYISYFSQRYQRYKDKVRFLGHVSEEDLNQLYRSCDLFVAPSLYESFGLIYLEAMNYAKPVIGCKAGGIPEVVEDGVTGLLVEPDASAPLAEAILKMLGSHTLLYEMGMAGRQHLLEKFTHIQMARSFVEVYRKVISEFAAKKGQS